MYSNTWVVLVDLVSKSCGGSKAPGAKVGARYVRFSCLLFLPRYSEGDPHGAIRSGGAVRSLVPVLTSKCTSDAERVGCFISEWMNMPHVCWHVDISKSNAHATDSEG